MRRKKIFFDFFRRKKNACVLGYGIKRMETKQETSTACKLCNGKSCLLKTNPCCQEAIAKNTFGYASLGSRKKKQKTKSTASRILFV